MGPASLIAAVNRLPVWRRPVRVWECTLVPPTFDRSLYLWLHRLDRMGREERAVFAQLLRPGMHAVDVGANIGLYSLLFARLVGPAGRVYAFEPDEVLAAALRANLAANGARHAEVVACAVGAAAGRATLRRNAMNSGDNRLTPLPAAVSAGDADVPVRTLADTLRGRRVDFVKIDVQGWEGEVLRGLGDLLDANAAMRIYFEFWPDGLARAGTSVAAFADLVRGLGLDVWQPHAGAPYERVDLPARAATLKPRGYTSLLASRERP